jgi:hypothetical protein
MGDDASLRREECRDDDGLGRRHDNRSQCIPDEPVID